MAIRTTGVRYDLIARDSASRTFSTVGGNAARLERGLGKLGKAALGVGAALGAGVAVGLAVGAKKAVAFEAEMKKIQTQAGATAGDVKTLSAQVLELGKTTQQGPEKLAESLYHLKSVGMDNVDAMKALRVASDLAAVGGSDLEATTNAMAGAWRTGIKGAESFAKTAATVNAIIGAGNMRMEDFTSAIGTGILPSAKSFGLSMQQVGAALALMTDEGIPATDAATRLRMSFSLLGAPSRAADKQLGKIGLTGLDLAEAMRGQDGLIGALTLLKGHLDNSGLSAARQSQILSRSFGGGRSSSGILTLLNNLDVLRKKQEQVNSSIGKYGPAVKAQRKTAAAQIALIKSNLEVFSIKAGNVLLPPLTSFVTYINKTAIPAATGFGQTLVHKFIPVDQIKSSFSTAQGLVTDFFAGLAPKDKKPVITLPTPTVKVPTTPIPDSLKKRPTYTLPTPTLKVPSTAIPSTVKAPAQTKSQAQAFGEQLRGLISGGIGDAVSDAVSSVDWGKLGSKLGEGLGEMTKWLTVHISDITKDMGKAVSGVDWVDIGKMVGGQALGFAIGFMTSMGRELFSPSFWKKHWLDTIIAVLSVFGVGKIAGPLSKIFSKIPVLRSAAPFLAKINGLTKPLGNGISKVLNFFGSSLWKGIARVFPQGAAILEREAGLFTTRIGVWGLNLAGAGGRAIRGLGNGIARGFGWVIAKIGEGIGYLLKPFASSGKWLIGRGSAIIGGLRAGAGRGAGKIGGWFTEHVIAPVKSAFTTSYTWLYVRGADLVAGLKGGVLSGAGKVGAWFKTSVIDKITIAFSKANTWLVTSGRDLVSGLISGTWKKMEDIGAWATSIKDKVVGAIKHVFGIHSPSRVMAELGGHMMSGLLKGLISGKDVLNSTVKGLFHSPLDAARALLSNGVSLSGEWLGKLGGLADTKGNAPLGKSVADAQNYAAELISEFWPKQDFATQMGSLRSLWMGESGWRWDAKNPVSGAYGIPQALPASKMASAGSDWQTNPRTQILWGLNYIKQRYGSPSAAYGDWLGHAPHWYAKGGLAPFGQTAWVGERGPELMQVTGRGTRIYSNTDSLALAKLGGIRVPGYAKGTTSAAGVAAAAASVAKLQRAVDELTADLKEARHKRLTATTKKQRHAAQLEVEAALTRLEAARKELTAARHKLTAAQAQARREAAAAKAQAQRVQGIANTIANGFLKTLTTGSAASIAAAIKGMNTRLQAAGAGRLVAGNLRTAAKLGALADRRSAVRSRIAEARQYSADKAAGLGEFLSVGGTQATSIGGLIKEMQTGQKAGADFAREVSSLGKRGLNKNLLGQLAEAGPGSQLATTLAGASAADIARLNQLAKFQSKLTISFGKSMADTMFDSGKNAGKGFLTGLIAQEKDLQKEMNKLAQGLIASIKKALGIKSPSTVMRDQVGRQLARGVAVGVRMHAPAAVAEVQRMADTAAAVRARGGYGHAGGGAPVGGAGTTVQHITNHREIHLHGAKQTSAEQAADLMRRMQAIS